MPRFSQNLSLQLECIPIHKFGFVVSNMPMSINFILENLLCAYDVILRHTLPNFIPFKLLKFLLNGLNLVSIFQCIFTTFRLNLRGIVGKSQHILIVLPWSFYCSNLIIDISNYGIN